MAKLNIPTGGDDGGGKKKFVLPGGGAAEQKGRLVVPGRPSPGGGEAGGVEEPGVGAVPDASEFGDVEPCSGDDFLIMEEAPRELTPGEPIRVAAMAGAGSEEVFEEEAPGGYEPDSTPVEVKPVTISSMAPPPSDEDAVVVDETEEEMGYGNAVAESPIVVPVSGRPTLVVPAVAEAPPALRQGPPMPPPMAATGGYGVAAGSEAPPAGYGYPGQGAPLHGAGGAAPMLPQGGYHPTPQRMVPGWALMLMGILLGMVITILAVKFSPLGEMLVGPVMTLEDVGYGE